MLVLSYFTYLKKIRLFNLFVIFVKLFKFENKKFQLIFIKRKNLKKFNTKYKNVQKCAGSHKFIIHTKYKKDKMCRSHKIN